MKWWGILSILVFYFSDVFQRKRCLQEQNRNHYFLPACFSQVLQLQNMVE